MTYCIIRWSSQLIHLNLSNTHLKKFQIFKNLFLNNPLKQIDHFEDIFRLTNLQLINLLSSTSTTTVNRSLTRTQWIHLANIWNNSNKSFLIDTNTISLQSNFTKFN